MIEQISSREMYRNNWLVVREDITRLPDGSQGIYGVVDKPDGVSIIPKDGEKFCLVEQFRYTLGRRQWEFPAGTAPDLAEEDPLVLAANELQEETGLHAGSMVELGTLDSAPNMSSQRNRIFLATELTQGPVNRELEEQDMRAGWFSRATIEDMIRTGEISCAHTVAAYGLLLLHERRA